MNWPGQGYLLLLLVSTLVSLALAGMAWQRRSRPGAVSVCATGLLVAVWAASSALEPLGATLAAKEFWVNVQYFGYALLPIAFLSVAVEQTGMADRLGRRRLALLLIIPGITILAAWTNPWHHLMRSQLHPEASGGLVFLGKTYGAWAWVNVAYAYAVVVVTIAVLAIASVRAPVLYRHQARVLLAAQALPALWPLLYAIHSPLSPRMDLSPAISSLSVGLMAFAVLRLGLCDIAPIARDRVIEGMGDGVLVLDRLGRIADLNAAAQRMLGVCAETVIGLPAVSALPHLPELLAAIADDMAATADAVLPVGKPTRYWQVHVTALVGRSGRNNGCVAVVRDVTRRLAIEHEQRRAHQRMLETQRLESLGVLAGGIAHTFNNLLMAIMADAELAAMKLGPDSPAEENLARVQAAAQRAAKVSGQMLAYSGKGRFVVRPTDLSAVVREMSSLLDAAAPDGASLRFDLAEGLPPVRADAGQVQQVVTSLVANAAEALGDLGGSIVISTGVLDADAAYLAATYPSPDLPAGTYLFLRVSDTGCGMDRSTAARAFDPFFSTKFLGRGLGLAAVLGIVRGHGGTIRVDSRPGEGSTFTVLFPCAAGG